MDTIYILCRYVQSLCWLGICVFVFIIFIVIPATIPAFYVHGEIYDEEYKYHDDNGNDAGL